MSEFHREDHPHRRFNLLTGEWVLVSPHRAKRPWQGAMEDELSEARPAHDPECYLCPGTARVGGERNPDYQTTYVFTNDFSALLSDAPAGGSEDELLRARSERGLCRVICFAPRHDLTLAEMDQPGIRRVVDLWTDQYRELGALDFVNHVQIFENKGTTMGCSNPHPHGQIWAQSTLPNEPAKELAQMRDWYRRRGRPLLTDYLERELAEQERLVCVNDGFVALVPFWAIWPFETLLLPRRHVASLLELEEGERDALADILRRLTTRYDNLFRTSFPYSAGLHQAPTDGRDHPEWGLHMHFYPPLLRSASIKKFMVGYEMLGGPQRDITPETSAARLREQSEVHYKAA